jgi:hypothetical protein
LTYDRKGRLVKQVDENADGLAVSDWIMRFEVNYFELEAELWAVASDVAA